jgi:hypothetical protein
MNDPVNRRRRPDRGRSSAETNTARRADSARAAAAASVALLALLSTDTTIASGDPYRGLHPYVGDIHVHSGLALYQVLDPNDPHSIGRVDEVLDAAEARGLDFVAITDHTNNLNDPRGIAWRRQSGHEMTLPDGTLTASEWAYTQAEVKLHDKPGRFVTILGLEYTRGTTGTASPGHQLGLFPGDTLPRYCSNFPTNVGDCPNAEDFFRFVREENGIAVMAHPCVAWGPSDWSAMDPVVNSMELVSGKCEFGKDGYNDVLSRGIRVGARGSSDSHHFEVGGNDKTICFAPRLTRAAILDAMRANLCYWVNQHPVTLTFSINGQPMGASVVDEGNGLVVEAAADTTWQTELDHIELIHDGKVALRVNCEDSAYAHCALKTAILSDTAGYYYVAVSNETNARLAISSPIWVGPGR